jgi:ornithine cyclodeaminase
MLTAFLTRRDVSRHVQALHLLTELKAAFTRAARPTSTQTLRCPAPAAGGSTLVRQAVLEGLPAYAVTVRAEWPHLTAPSRTVLQLHDATSGRLLAVMDAGQLAVLRASLVSAVAAEALAASQTRHVAVLGSGLAASGALKALRLVRSVDRVWLYEPDPVANTELAVRLQSTLATSARGTDSAEEAVAEADLVILTGGVALPADALKPGAHVTVLAAEAFAQSPLPEAFLARARRFSDTPEGALGWGEPFVDLGHVLSGAAPGRGTGEEATVFVSQGPAWLDLVAAWHVYEGARHDETLTRVDLEA